MVADNQLQIVELITIHGGSAEGADFTGFYQIVQRFHGLLHGCRVIETVDDVKIETIGSQPLQTAVDLAEDGFTGEPAGIKVDFGSDDDFASVNLLFSARPRYSSLVPAE